MHICSSSRSLLLLLKSLRHLWSVVSRFVRTLAAMRVISALARCSDTGMATILAQKCQTCSAASFALFSQFWLWRDLFFWLAIRQVCVLD